MEEVENREQQYINAVSDRIKGKQNDYKPIVKYSFALDKIVPGYSAKVIPIDHPSFMVDNWSPCTTSSVVSYDPETGDFETQNTKYVRIKSEEF